MANRDRRRRELREAARQRSEHWETVQSIVHGPLPRIVVHPDRGRPDFVAAVRKALQGFSFDDAACCDLVRYKHYKAIGALGFGAWLHSLPGLLADEIGEEQELQTAVSQTSYAVYCHLGEWIFAHLPPNFTTQVIPDYFYQVAFTDREIHIGFHFMDTAGDASNPLYLPPGNPTVVMQGATWTVGLYRHAVERLFGRLCGFTKANYRQLIYIYNLLSGRTLLFDHLQLKNGEEALRVAFEVSTIPGTSSHYDLYVRQIFGERNLVEGAGPLHVVAGYLPLHIQGKYARAKTFLFPGYSWTPEDDAARTGKAPPHVRRKLVQMAQDNTFANVIEGDTLECIKWYHENGVPQVFYRTPASNTVPTTDQPQ